MKLAILTSDASCTRLECEGEITQVGFAPGLDPLTKLLGEGCYNSKVLLNLEKATFLDSSGVGWFVHLQKKFNEAGGRIVLHSIPPMLNQVLRLLRMQTVLHLAEDEAAALALLRGEPA